MGADHKISIKIKPLPVLVLLPLLALLIYSNIFSAPFLFDDIHNILENPNIRHPGNFLDISSSRYLGFLTFALNYRFGGLNVFGYHLVNLLIHITNGFLVYSLVLLLFRAVNSSQPPSPWIPLFTALLFISHPIQTQAVTYIVQRFASLATIFYLLGVVAYLKWRTGDRFLWYGIALVATVLGMKTKEFVFTLPFMILMVEILFFEKRRWASLVPFFLTLAIIPLSRFDVLMGEDVPLFSGTIDISRSDYLFTQFRVIVTYLRLLVFPIQQNLDYDYPIFHSLFAPPVFVSFLFLAGLFGLAVYLIRRTRAGAVRLIAFGILWFFLTLSAESSIIPIKDIFFEHRLYLPSVGFSLVISLLAAWGWGRWKRIRVPLAVIGFLIVGGLSVATYQRNLVWQTPLTLWQDVVNKAPRKARGHYSLGKAYQMKGLLEPAIQAYQKALSLQPNYLDAALNLGVATKNLGRWEEAVRIYRTALDIEPDHAEAHNNLGSVYSSLGRLDEAILEYETAVKLQYDFVEARYNLGKNYYKKGRLPEAIKEFELILQIKPDFLAARGALESLKKKGVGHLVD